jgi:hypothetical protein
MHAIGSLPNGPSSPVDMAVDYFTYDYEFAEPPRVTSLQNTVPLPTFTDFGDDTYFVADQRGYESVVHHLAGQYLNADKSGNIADARLKLNKVDHITSDAMIFSVRKDELIKHAIIMVVYMIDAGGA